MGWRDRAQPADGGWRARAEPVEAEAAEAAPAGKVASPTGWREPEQGLADKLAAGAERQAGLEPLKWGALSAMAHGAANAMEGPINGAIAGLKASLPMPGDKEPPSWDSIVKAYRGERDRIQAEQRPNLKDFPAAPAVGAVLATPGSAPSMLGRLAMGAGQGALYGLGSSEGDLTKGETGKVADDVKTGALWGLGGAGAGEVLQIPGRMLAKRAGKISDATHAAELAAETEARAGAVKSAAGAEGGLTAHAMKSWDRLQDAMFNPAANEETKAWARAFIQSDEGKALYNQVLKNYADEAPTLMGKLGAAKEARAAANAANDPELIRKAAEAAAEAKLGDTSAVTGRLAELFRRNAPAAVGTALGGPAGAAAGALYSGVSGKPGRILTNMFNAPGAVPYYKGAATGGVGGGQSMSRAVPPLAEWSRFFGPDDDEAP